MKSVPSKSRNPLVRNRTGARTWTVWRFLCIFSGILVCSPWLTGAGASEQQAGPGFAKEFSSTLDDALQALREVVQDRTIHGTQIYDKQPVLTGATAVDSTPLFDPWTGDGKVFYKIFKGAIAPRHFLASEDQGTIAVRYVLTSVSPERVRLRVDAVYVENSHRTRHISDGTVEASETKAVEEHLVAIQSAAEEATEASRRRESSELLKEMQHRQRADETTLLSSAQSSAKELQQQISSLRHELERRIRAPGTEMKAAPFRSSARLATLPAYTEVVVVIVTPHWYGVETPDGKRGWVYLTELEPLP
jgi:hypothetical protein